MRVIFLDFDGVLNTETDVVDDSTELWTASWLDAALVARLARLVEYAKARVVVSSSWRQRRSPQELAAILAARGFPGGVHDVTPRLPRSPDGERFVRAKEVATWLEQHPEVEAFVILDDDQDFGELSAFHVRIDSKRGFTDEDLDRALAVLRSHESALPT